jgi:hypothetical protein
MPRNGDKGRYMPTDKTRAAVRLGMTIARRSPPHKQWA